MDHTINIDVIDKSVPESNHINIAVINKPNPVSNYTANAKEVGYLIQFPQYYIYEAGTDKIINGSNYYDYFPEENPGGGVLISKNITENGTYTAKDDSADGYSDVNVDVPELVGHTLIVTTIPNAEVTVSNTSNTYTCIANSSGEARFEGVAAGTYDVSATYDEAASDTTSITISDYTATEDSFATLTISASDNTTITLTNGTITKTIEYSGTPIVQYISLGTWDLSCEINGTEITRTVSVNTYTNHNVLMSIVLSRYVNFSNNTTTLEGNASVHPVYKNINRCNVSDNGTINAFYGDDNYIEDGSNGQVMVYIPKFYYKVTPDQNGGLSGSNIRKCTWVISADPVDGFKLHPAFHDASGNEIDYFLFGAFDSVGQNTSGTYATSNNSSPSRLSSVAGSNYFPSNNFKRSTGRVMGTNRGTGWYQIGVKQVMAILMLMGVEYGFNSQIGIGNGVCAALTSAYPGKTVGNITSGDKEGKETSVNWRGIENFWGSINDFVDGLNIYNRTPYFCNSYSFVDDTTSGYTQVGFALPSSGGYITAFGYDSTNDWVLLPSEVTASSVATGPIGDYVYTSTNWCVSYFGGSQSNNLNAGAFYGGYNDNSSYTSGSIGSRIMYIPSAV